jgi:hypothetical protein
VNTLRKQQRTNDKGLSYSCGVGRGANNSPYKISLLRNVNMSLVRGRILWINNISDGRRTRDLGYRMLEDCIGQVH